MAESSDTPIELDPAALSSFAESLEKQVENRLHAGATDLEARFFPAGRGDEQRPFGRSPHHPGQRDLGTAQQHNVAAHLDEMARLRESIATLRQAAQQLRTHFQDVEQTEARLGQQLNDAAHDLQGPR